MFRTVVTIALLAAPALARAQPLLPGPGAPDHDAEVAARIDGLARTQDALLSRPVGFGLEGFVSDPADRAAIEAFAASSSRDFTAVTGLHPHEVIDRYEEQGDLGMFGGVQAAGVAWRYAVLREEGAPAAELDAARAALVRALDGLHWYTAVTGEPGAIARGIMRIVPEAGEPAIPFPPQEIVPLTDAAGQPLPADKHAVWRADRSGELPFLIWFDDTSKDQFDGYVLALGAAYDAIVDDPSFDPALVDRLRDDATAIGRRLLRRIEVGSGMTADLVLVDADGRPTTFHDLSAEEVSPGAVFARPLNGFNALMAMGALRTLFHIGGDPEIGAFYYQTLVGDRDYFDPIERTVHLVYMGLGTNYSNVNMAFVAIWGVLRYETDPVIAPRMRAVLEEHLYAPGVDREARGLSRPFFDLLYAGMRDGGAGDAAGAQALSDAVAAFRAHPAAPYWNPAVINCDDAEIAALSCTAIDGTTTIALAPMLGRLDTVVAVDPVPLALRPASNFEHRSDPHAVNGDANDRLNPAGDVVAAYWMGRLLSREGGDANVSPHARPALPWTPRARPDAGPPGADAGPVAPASSGCACRAGAADRAGAPVALAGVLALVLAWRRRARIRARESRGRRALALAAVAAVAALGCGSASATATTTSTTTTITAVATGDDRPHDQGALAQLDRTWRDGTTLACEIRWSSPGTPWLYDGTMSLARTGVAVEGTIDWRLLQADVARFPQLATRVGERATERIEGRYDAPSRTLLLATTQVSDDSMVGYARYRLVLAGDGSIRGETAGTDDGVWDGLLECARRGG